MSTGAVKAGGMSAVKLALMARRLRAEGAGLDVLTAEPIAVVGMGCRFPGGANSPAEFWQLLERGVDAISLVPAARWSADALYDPDPAAPGKMTTRWGGFLDQVDRFDAGAFGISPREAARMDPQQRLLLEVAYEALEDAGQPPDALSGSRAGVFVGSYNDDYAHLQWSQRDQIDAYTSTGTAQGITANRLSFLLNLRGPSLTVDTACSSSLVAVHLACQSLRAQECDVALTGGVSLILSPEQTISLSKWGFMTEDGRCKTFDARANGFVRGEGCGMVVLKRLSDALAEGDRVLAVIRGSAVNQDGRTNVLTAPSGLAQQAVIRQALANGQVAPEQITYVEAHGTGTALGDPIEVEALAEVLGQPRADGRPCFVASVKTNIGHLEAAAGIAGLIKVVLCLQHGVIPPHLHFEELNPHIRLSDTRLVIGGEAHPWPSDEEPRRAGISSFGFGGTNAHAIVEEAPRLRQPAPDDAESPWLLPLSAHGEAALRQTAERYADFLQQAGAGPTLRDVCYTASVRRAHHDHRLAVVGRSRDEIVQRLHQFLAGDGGAVRGRRLPGKRPRVVFAFSGQGPQWWAMGRELLQREPVFRAAVERCDGALRAYTDWSLLAELVAEESGSRLGQTEIAQPAIFALQVGLAALWQSWGIVPDAVLGHSVGEVAAAHVAGVLDLEDALRVVYHRGRLMREATGQGRMAAVELPEAATAATIAPWADRVSVAAVNSPTQTVIAGAPDVVTAALAALHAAGVRTHLLPVPYAFHSPQMEPFRSRLERALAGLAPRPAVIPLISTVTGRAAADGDYDAAYWGRNLRETVRFADALQALTPDASDVFVEISPHPVLAGAIGACLAAAGCEAPVVPSLRRGVGEREVMLASLGQLHVRGCPVAWERLFPDGGACVSLPLYPWQRERYWLDAPPAAGRGPAANPAEDRATAGHPLLGERLRSPALQGAVFETRLTLAAIPFLRDHRLLGAAVLPLTAYLEVVAAAADAVLGAGPHLIEDLTIQAPLVLPEEDARVVQIHLAPDGQGGASFAVFSLQGEDHWTRHAAGRVVAADDTALGPAARLDTMASPEGTEIASEAYYAAQRARGLDFGPAFRGIARLYHCRAEALARVELGEEASQATRYWAHPALLDAALQALMAVVGGEDADPRHAYLPVGLEAFRRYRRAGACGWSRARLRPRDHGDADTLCGDVTLFDDTGAAVADVVGLRLRRASRDDLARALGLAPRYAWAEWVYELAWQPAPREGGPGPDLAGRWLVLADRGGVGRALAERLRAGGGECVLVSEGDDRTSETEGTEWVDPACADAFRRLLAGDREGEGPAYRGVVHLWSLDLDGGPTTACAGVLHLAQALARQATPPALWLVTRGGQPVDGSGVSPAQAPVWGLASTLGLEHPDIRWACVDLDPCADQDAAAAALAGELAAPDGEDAIAFRAGGRYVARLTRAALDAPDAQPPAEALPAPRRLEISTRGVLDDLVLRPVARRPPGVGEVEIQVRAAGLNFRDVLNALDLYSGEAGLLGDECAGEIVAVGPGVSGLRVGDLVVGFASGSFGSYVTTRAELVVAMPDGWTFAEAAAVPIAFVTAAYGLKHLAALTAGERILIHAAAGGVGLAAVRLAQLAGAEVFATAGSPEKRAFLRSLGVEHVMDSRSLDFADEIMTLTRGRGVDVVLNSLADKFIPRTLAVLAQGGRFVEIGKRGVWEPAQVARARPDVRYWHVFLGDQMAHEPALIRSLLREVLDALVRGALAPLPRRVFPLTRAGEAFRYMAQAKHIGKIVLSLEPGLSASGGGAPTLRPDGTYLVTGGLGGIGQHVARWLVGRGARHLVLVGRRGAQSPGADDLRRELEAAGARVEVAGVDVARADDLAALLQTLSGALPPLRGVIHAAGVADDGVLLQQDWPRFAAALRAKLEGAWHLHCLTRHAPLDFFVLFSSVAGVFGWPGQGSYAAANAYLGALAAQRRAEGLPALCVAWGNWADTGLTAALDAAGRARLAERGLCPMVPADALGALEQALRGPLPAPIIAAIDWSRFAADRARPLFSAIARPRAPGRPAPSAAAERSTILQQWTETPPARRRGLLLGYLREEVVRALGLPPAQPIAPRQAFRDLGLDSLIAVELRNTLSRAFDWPLPATLLFDQPTSDALADYLIAHVPALAATDPASASHAEPNGAADLLALSEAEAEALLIAELNGVRD